MDRDTLLSVFSSSGPIILPVIHVINNQQVELNIRIALDNGCKGIFLINHDFPYPQFIPLICNIRERFPQLWLGVNFLGITGHIAFPILGTLKSKGIMVDAYWADDARINEKLAIDKQIEAKEILNVKTNSGWDGLYFGGTAFKKQRKVEVEDYSLAASIASDYMDIVTTSGVATGQAPNLSKVKIFRKACKSTPLALASGTTRKNASIYASYVDIFMVATGINIKGDFYNIETKALRELINIINK